MLIRLLFLIFLVFLLISLIRKYLAPRRPTGGTGPSSTDKGEDMVFDPQCKSYVPIRDAIQEGENYFCSRECARLYLGR